MRLCLFLLLLAGCSSVRVESVAANGTRTVASALVPAYPWQDAAQVIQRLNASATTNRSTLSLRDVNQSEITNTNTLNFFKEAIAAVVEAAIKSAK